jgi:hypothetical protein
MGALGPAQGGQAAAEDAAGIDRRKTGYKWLGRYERGGAEALNDQASTARRCPHRTGDEVIDRLVLLRKERAAWGPRKLRNEEVGLGP